MLRYIWSSFFQDQRSLGEILDVDIRDFPVELRLTCLESITMRLLSQVGHRLDRFSEVSAVGLGLDPNSTATLCFLPPSTVFGKLTKELTILKDDRLRVLALSTIAGAKNLPRPRLLVLAACLRQFPGMVNSKSLASVLRLITHQVGYFFL